MELHFPNLGHNEGIEYARSGCVMVIDTKMFYAQLISNDLSTEKHKEIFASLVSSVELGRVRECISIEYQASP